MSSTNQIFIIIISLYHLDIPLLLNRFDSNTTFYHLNLIVNVGGKFFRAFKASGSAGEPLSDDLFKILISELLHCLLVIVNDEIVDFLGVRHE
jgi:hypothetical protein